MAHGDAQEVGKRELLLEDDGLRGGVGERRGRGGRRMRLWSMYICESRGCPGGRKEGALLEDDGLRGGRDGGREGGKQVSCWPLDIRERRRKSVKKGRASERETIPYLSDEEPGKEMRGEVEEAHHVHVLYYLSNKCVQKCKWLSSASLASLSLLLPALSPSLPPPLPPYLSLEHPTPDVDQVATQVMA